MSDHPGPQDGVPLPPSDAYPPGPPPPPPIPVPPPPLGPDPRQRHPALPWVVAGVAVALLVIVTGVVLIRGDDDASTSTDAERVTTTSEPPSTPTSSDSPTTNEAATALFFPEDLNVGDCFDDSAHGTLEVGEITPIDCVSPHDGEVFALVTLPGAPDTPYPGDDEITRQGDELCVAQFAPYVGIDYLDSQWEYGWFAPIEDSWRKYDDRLVICYLADRDYNKVEGSKRNSGT
jgi:hypothetical protein